MLRNPRRRRGTHLMECAVVFPVTFLLLLGLIIGALGVFRYQEVASLAREGARYASVRGYEYQLVTSKPAATPDDVYNNVISPRAVILDPSRLSSTVTWNPDNKQGSTVTVTVTYQWVPEAFLGGLTLSSTSTTPISY
jgi:Flp pilus assembly protein TadG